MSKSHGFMIFPADLVTYSAPLMVRLKKTQRKSEWASSRNSQGTGLVILSSIGESAHIIPSQCLASVRSLMNIVHLFILLTSHTARLQDLLPVLYCHVYMAAFPFIWQEPCLSCYRKYCGRQLFGIQSQIVWTNSSCRVLLGSDPGQALCPNFLLYLYQSICQDN